MNWQILVSVSGIAHEANLTRENGSAMLIIGTVRWTGTAHEAMLRWPTGFIT